MSDSDEVNGDGFFPEIKWNEHVIWRGERQSGREDAYYAAMRLAVRFAPTVDAESRPALVLAFEDGESIFPLGYPAYEYRSEYRSENLFDAPMQHACKVFAEMRCLGTPAVAWEPVVVSDNRVIWKVKDGLVPSEDIGYAQNLAESVLYELHPAVLKCWDGQDKWEPGIARQRVWGAQEQETARLGDWSELDSENAGWTTRAEAWRLAAQTLAVAEATTRQAEMSEPLVTNTELRKASRSDP